ncbi:helix-turn-helix domain-containing protein [Streptomyces sp. NPDC051561]|uniref:helix-turn-helix domain-containing protein n=1 Tax=Streptomyces sp. NPDC051561 TaxID=3365658 RepID=UPI0037B4C81D
MAAVPDERSVAMCRILLRLQLRRYREARGMSASSVAKRFGWSIARMTRLETSNNVVEMGDVRLLCDLYEVPAGQRDELEGYALITKTRKDWWETAPFKGAVPAWFSAFLGLESAADSICMYQGEFVPGLLQSPDYALAILRLSGADDKKIELNAEVRMKRQSILTRTDYAPAVSVVLNEAVLRRPVGGADVMRKQLNSIAAVAQLPNVTVRVLPFHVGEHPGMHGPFQVLTFPDSSVEDLAYVENLVDAGVITQPELVDAFKASHEQLSGLALSEAESLDMLNEAAQG